VLLKSWAGRPLKKAEFFFFPSCRLRPLAHAVVKEVWSDLRPAFYLMLIVMWGFATAFNIALRRDQDAQEVGWDAAL
jgi:hypothetical protein